MPYAHLDGVSLYHEEAGSPEPAVFVHGGFPSLALAVRDGDDPAWTWEGGFARSFHFVAYDRRGCYRWLLAR